MIPGTSHPLVPPSLPARIASLSIPLILCLFSCSGEAPVPPARTITIPEFFNNITTLNPFLTGRPAEIRVSRLVFGPGLEMRWAAHPQIEGLAASWTSSEQDRVWTARLRPGLTFHDGRPLTSRDVVFTYERAMTWGRKAHSVWNATPRNVEVKALDADRIRFTLLEGDDGFPERHGTLPILPAHLLGDFDFERFATWGRSSPPVGAGPYRIVEWERNRVIRLRACDTGAGSEAAIKEIVFRFLWPDAVAGDVQKLLQAGEVDMMRIDPLIAGPEERNATCRVVNFLPDREWILNLALNHRRGQFADSETRRALYHALDRESIIREVKWEGSGSLQVAHGPVPPTSWAYLEEMPRREYDPAKAQALLARAGWADGDGDGIVDRDGTPFTFEVLYPTQNRPREEALRIMLLNLREVGIRMIPRPVALTEMFTRTRTFDYDAAFFFNSFMPGMQLLYDHGKIREGYSPERNMYAYRNAELKELTAVITEELSAGKVDEAMRPRLLPIYHRIQQIVAADAPSIYIWVEGPQILFVHRRFGNLLDAEGRLNPLFLWTVEE